MTISQQLKLLAVKAAYPFFRYYWHLFHPQSRGVVCVVVREDQIALIRNTYRPSYWSLPGGGIKRGEKLEDAVIRELCEETGITKIRDLTYLGSVLSHQEEKEDTVHIFTAQTPQDIQNFDPVEILKAQWFPLGSIPKNLSDYTQEGLALAKIHYAGQI